MAGRGKGERFGRVHRGNPHPTRRPSSRVERRMGRGADLTVQKPLRAVRQSGPGHRGNAPPVSPGYRAWHGEGDRAVLRKEDPERLRFLRTQGCSQSFPDQARSRLLLPMRHPQCGCPHETRPAPRGPHLDGVLPRRTLHPGTGGGLRYPALKGPVLPRRFACGRAGLGMQAHHFLMRLPSRPRFPRHGRKKSPPPLHGLHLPGRPPREAQ